MRLKSLELLIEWPSDLPFCSLRPFLIDKIKRHGDPLRWAITSSAPSKKAECYRALTLEAVVIIF